MSHADRIRAILADGGIHQHKEFIDAGVPAVVVKRLLDRRVIEQIRDDRTDIKLGYVLHGVELDTRHMRLAAIAKRHPSGVLCFHSALAFHELTDDSDADDIIAVKPGAWQGGARRRADQGGDGVERSLHIISWHDGRLLEVGVDTVQIMGFPLSVTNPTRTVVDCFRVAAQPSKRILDSGIPFPSRDDAFHALRLLVIDRDGGGDEISKISDCAHELGCEDIMDPILTAMRMSLKSSPVRSCR